MRCSRSCNCAMASLGDSTGGASSGMTMSGMVVRTEPEAVSPEPLSVGTGEPRGSELHQRSNAIRIDANDYVARELLGVFPLVRRAGGNDEDVTLGNRDILGTNRRCSGAAPAVTRAHRT